MVELGSTLGFILGCDLMAMGLSLVSGSMLSMNLRFSAFPPPLPFSLLRVCVLSQINNNKLSLKSFKKVWLFSFLVYSIFEGGVEEGKGEGDAHPIQAS